MAGFLPAEHWKEDASGRKHTRPPPHKDASWDFLRGAGPSAAAEGETLTTTNKAAFRPGWQEHRHEAKIQPSKERLAYERIQEAKHQVHAEERKRFLGEKAQYNGFNPVTGQEYRPPAPHAHHVPTVTGANIDHDPLLQHGSDHADRSTIMTWKQPRPSPAGQDFGEQRQTQTEHIQEMRKGRIMNEGLAHVKSTSVRDCLQRP